MNIRKHLLSVGIMIGKTAMKDNSINVLLFLLACSLFLISLYFVAFKIFWEQDKKKVKRV